jgi:RNA polymerase sigma-70 factor (ECF subfamily)
VDDAEAVRLVLAGDRNGAAYLIEKYQMDVYTASLRILSDPADAEDVTQDTFLAALDRMSTYRPDQALSPWLRAIARNRAIDLVRRRARAPKPEPPAAAESVEALALDRLEAERIRTAMRRLPARERALLALRYWEDQPVEVIARALGMTDGAVRVALLRARRALGALLAEWKTDSPSNPPTGGRGGERESGVEV